MCLEAGASLDTRSSRRVHGLSWASSQARSIFHWRKKSPGQAGWTPRSFGLRRQCIPGESPDRSDIPYSGSQSPTLPPPGVQSHSETPRHQKGSTGEPGGWAHTSLSAPKHLLDGTHVRTCAGPGRGHSGAQVSHTERKRLWGDRARLRAGQAREPGAAAVRCRRRKGGARAGRVSPQQAGLSTQPPAWKAVPLNSTTGPRLKLPT